MRTVLFGNDEETETLRGLRTSDLGSQGNLVGLAQKPNGTADIVGIPKKDADPAGFRKNVMRLSLSAFHQLIPEVQWKRDVNEAVAVHVANFPAANAVFGPAKAMRCMSDFFPLSNRLVDFLSSTLHRHGFTPLTATNSRSRNWMRGYFSLVLAT